jgi:hypothetical protein
MALVQETKLDFSKSAKNDYGINVAQRLDKHYRGEGIAGIPEQRTGDGARRRR